MSKIIITIIVLLFLVALRAQQPLTFGVPADTIAYYNRTVATGCPTGWTELTAAKGAALVGLVNGGTKASLPVGATAYTIDQEDRTHVHTMTHTHSLSAHTHTFSGTTLGPSATFQVSDTGENHDGNTSAHTHTYSGTSAVPNSDVTDSQSAANTGVGNTKTTPYMQLLFCKKT